MTIVLTVKVSRDQVPMIDLLRVSDQKTFLVFFFIFLQIT